MAYVASSDVKQYGGVPSSDSVDDVEITLLIGRAQKYIENYTGRVFESDSDSESTRYFTAIDDVEGRVLYLDQDLLAVATITAGQSSDTIVASDYVTEPRNDTPYFALRLKDNSDKCWDEDTSDGDYENAIVVNGQWAYSASPPADIKHATIRLVRWYYEQGRVNPQDERPVVLESGVTVLPAAIPSDIKEILNYYRRLEHRS